MINGGFQKVLSIFVEARYSVSFSSSKRPGGLIEISRFFIFQRQ